MSLPATSQHGHDYTTRETLTLHRPYRQQSVNQSTSNLYASSQTPKMGLGVSSLKRRQHTRSTPDLHLSQMETYSFHGEMGNEGLIDTYIDSDSDLSRRTGDGQYAEPGGYLTNGSTHSLDIDNDQFFNVNSQFHKYRIPNDASQPYSPVHRNDYNSTVNMHEGRLSIALSFDYIVENNIYNQILALSFTYMFRYKNELLVLGLILYRAYAKAVTIELVIIKTNAKYYTKIGNNLTEDHVRKRNSIINIL